MKKKALSRRNFIEKSSTSAFGALVLPRHILGGPGFTAPSDKLNIASIGSGGMGASNMTQVLSENIVAICDPDDKNVAESIGDWMVERRPERGQLRDAYNKAKRYTDYREMLDKQKDIDAVVIATPDHSHAPAAAKAMKLGKHVYVQKPLTYTVKESRVLAQIAAETDVVTQMGNQGHSHDGGRQLIDWIWGGAIGEVSEAHIWTNRPVWPQGIPRPEKEKVRKGLDWDLWLGPRPKIDYNSAYMPFTWRGWTDWGTGVVGDMGAHLIDHAYWVLGLDAPTSISASGSPFGGKERSDKHSFPMASQVNYEFGRGGRKQVDLTWYDGGLLPRRPEMMPWDAQVKRGGGCILIGTKGVAVYDEYGHNPRLFPKYLEEEYANTGQLIRRIDNQAHEMNWVNSCKGLDEPSSPLSYAGPLTETMLLGNVALMYGYGKKLFWDPIKMEFPNAPDANELLHYDYREGWEL